MSNTDHSKIRRAARMPLEGRNRTRLRATLRMGDWDSLPTTMPSRVMRRPVI